MFSFGNGAVRVFTSIKKEAEPFKLCLSPEKGGIGYETISLLLTSADAGPFHAYYICHWREA